MILDEYKWYSAAGELVSIEDIIEDIKIAYKNHRATEIHVGTHSDPNGDK